MVEASKGLVRVLADCTERDAHEGLRTKYGLKGFPFVAFLSPDGVKVNEVCGAAGADLVLAAMRPVLERFDAGPDPVDLLRGREGVPWDRLAGGVREAELAALRRALAAGILEAMRSSDLEVRNRASRVARELPDAPPGRDAGDLPVEVEDWLGRRLAELGDEDYGVRERSSDELLALARFLRGGGPPPEEAAGTVLAFERHAVLRDEGGRPVIEVGCSGEGGASTNFRVLDPGVLPARIRFVDAEGRHSEVSVEDGAWRTRDHGDGFGVPARIEIRPEGRR